jgi:hypothetical protein
MSGVVGSAFVLVVFLVTKGKLESFFSVMLSLTASTTAVSYFGSSRRWSGCGGCTPTRTGPTGCPAARQAPGPRRSYPRRSSW